MVQLKIFIKLKLFLLFKIQDSAIFWRDLKFQLLFIFQSSLNLKYNLQCRRFISRRGKNRKWELYIYYYKKLALKLT